MLQIPPLPNRQKGKQQAKYTLYQKQHTTKINHHVEQMFKHLFRF